MLVFSRGVEPTTSFIPFQTHQPSFIHLKC